MHFCVVHVMQFPHVSSLHYLRLEVEVPLFSFMCCRTCSLIGNQVKTIQQFRSLLLQCFPVNCYCALARIVSLFSPWFSEAFASASPVISEACSFVTYQVDEHPPGMQQVLLLLLLLHPDHQLHFLLY